MRNTTITRFMTRLFGSTPSRAVRERAYLDASVSLYDLERREREIDQGRFAGT